jgi:light-regulated signal transduction histidine kinase (bacteriophytochrome)
MEQAMSIRTDVATFFRDVADQIEDAGEAMGGEYSIDEHDWIHEGETRCVDVFSNLDEAAEAFRSLEGRNVALYLFVQGIELRVQRDAV